MSMLRRKDMKAKALDARLLITGVIALSVTVSVGCSARTLTIVQTDRVNTAMQDYLPWAERTGQPLEVAIVCVHSEDLENAENEPLRPRTNVTCKTWYERQPEGGGGAKTQFKLRKDQIYLLTNDPDPYGTHAGPALNGAIKDGRSVIPVSGIRFPGGKLFGRGSVIYVFAKFVNRKGDV